MGWERPPAAAWEVRLATYRYSRWDGTQQVFELDEDSIMDSLTDDILAHGDVERALRDLLWRGMRDDQGERVEGLRDLRERLQQQRQRQLECVDAPGHRPV